MGDDKYLQSEYERIRMKYIAKNMRTLLKCINKRLSDAEFDAIKGDLLSMVEDI